MHPPHAFNAIIGLLVIVPLAAATAVAMAVAGRREPGLLAALVILVPVSCLAVRELLDEWGERHTAMRRAMLCAVGSAPVLAGIAAAIAAAIS